MKKVTVLLLLTLCLTGYLSRESAYDDMKNYRLTFLMSGMFQLENEEYRDYLEDGRNGWSVSVDNEHCVKTEYLGATYYAGITSLS